ncbi:MAG: GYD domain-containing protein [Gammaproteobacteria bacterium]|nr:GYD domain-containing protein [Gammaproteobacteria bacterium]NDG45293.1 GYD domain-containing protein [Gammaproteobacteria bacterium]
MGAWMAFGGDDLVVIADMPDDASMAGVALAVSAAGAIVGGKTTRLLDMPTAVEGMKKAKAVFDAYKPPS